MLLDFLARIFGHLASPLNRPLDHAGTQPGLFDASTRASFLLATRPPISEHAAIKRTQFGTLVKAPRTMGQCALSRS